MILSSLNRKFVSYWEGFAPYYKEVEHILSTFESKISPESKIVYDSFVEFLFRKPKIMGVEEKETPSNPTRIRKRDETLVTNRELEILDWFNWHKYWPELNEQEKIDTFKWLESMMNKVLMIRQCDDKLDLVEDFAHSIKGDIQRQLKPGEKPSLQNVFPHVIKATLGNEKIMRSIMRTCSNPDKAKEKVRGFEMMGMDMNKLEQVAANLEKSSSMPSESGSSLSPIEAELEKLRAKELDEDEDEEEEQPQPPPRPTQPEKKKQNKHKKKQSSRATTTTTTDESIPESEMDNSAQFMGNLIQSLPAIMNQLKVSDMAKFMQEKEKEKIVEITTEDETQQELPPLPEETPEESSSSAKIEQLD